MGKISVSKQSPPILGHGVYYKDIPYKNEADFVVEITNWIDHELRDALAAPSARKMWFEVEKYSSDFDGDLA